MTREQLGAVIRAWLEDEQERQGFNIPDAYLDWFDQDELAGAVLAAFGAVPHQPDTEQHTGPDEVWEWKNQ